MNKPTPLPIRRVAVANDHAAVSMKKTVVEALKNMGFEVADLGTHDEQSVDYPDYADLLAAKLKDGSAEMGVLLCGSGIGISIAANRHRHVRAALCSSAEAAGLSRQHNNANVLVLGARLTPPDVALDCVSAFFSTPFEGGRHEKRVAKLC